MGSTTFAGYWTGTYDQEKHIFRVDQFVAAPTTITWAGDSLVPGQAITGPGGFYFGYSESAGGTDLLIADNATTLPVILYSNTLTFSRGERVPTQAANWPCLLAGTLVATPAGERPVQDLRPGDLVLTPEGDAVAVRWVGRRSALAAFAGPDAVPVTILAGALADQVPAVDLHVSPDHAVLVDGVLVNARALVNGLTIQPMAQPPERIEYYHLELDRHRLIVANGTPVESFVDDVSRDTFDNVAEWRALALPPLPADALPYRKVKSARQLPRATADRLDARAGSLLPAWS